jgi:cytochrome bd-type quinol oxidase subunit 1
LSTKWSVIGAVHGALGSLIFISGGIGLYLGYRLLTGQLNALRDLQIASGVTALAALATIMFGNWLYIGYRQPGMIQDYFLDKAPELHLIFFEFKENIALFTVPLAVAACFILARYGPELKQHLWLRTVIFLLLGLVFLFFLIAFGLGAAITKIKPV